MPAPAPGRASPPAALVVLVTLWLTLTTVRSVTRPGTHQLSIFRQRGCVELSTARGLERCVWQLPQRQNCSILKEQKHYPEDMEEKQKSQKECLYWWVLGVTNMHTQKCFRTVSWQRLPGAQLTLSSPFSVETRLTQKAETSLCWEAPSSFSVFQKETNLALWVKLVETGDTNMRCRNVHTHWTMLASYSTQNHCPGHGMSSRICHCGSVVRILLLFSYSSL